MKGRIRFVNRVFMSFIFSTMRVPNLWIRVFIMWTPGMAKCLATIIGHFSSYSIFRK